MLRPLILAQDPRTAEALRAVTALRDVDVADEYLRVVDAGTSQNPSRAFREVAGWLDKTVASASFPSDQVVVFVDTVRADALNPLDSHGWDALIAMLILAFPEVHWVFGHSSPPGQGADRWKPVARWHSLASFLSGFNGSPLFDGSGLRQHVITQVKTKTDDETGALLAPLVPERREWAAAIDEESSYAFLNAYICYRFGFRAWPVTSDELFTVLFGGELLDEIRKRAEDDGARRLLTEEPNASDQKIEAAKHRYAKRLLHRYQRMYDQHASLTFEDLYLGFPDKTNDSVHYSNLQERTQKLPHLAEVKLWRSFVTAGHRHRSQQDDNRAFLEQLRQSGKGGKILFKPMPGMFTLWEQAGLFRDLRFRDSDGRCRPGYAKGFIWPPCRSRCNTSVGPPSRHSAPGRLLQISEFLIMRAERCMSDGVTSVPAAVHGAVLSSLAQELLGDQTPTTARDALELKHRFEVLAECQFGGVEFHINVKPRLAEIDNELRLIGDWFHSGRKTVARLNGLLAIVTRLLTIFLEHEEFDEAEECRRKVRDLHRQIWARRPLAWPVWPIRWYTEQLAGSLHRMFWAILASLLLIVLINVGYDVWRDPTIDWSQSEVWFRNLSESTKHFVGGEPWAAGDNKPWDWIKVSISVVAAMWGFLHLGILISHIYRLLSRA